MQVPTRNSGVPTNPGVTGQPDNNTKTITDHKLSIAVKAMNSERGKNYLTTRTIKLQGRIDEIKRNRAGFINFIIHLFTGRFTERSEALKERNGLQKLVRYMVKIHSSASPTRMNGEPHLEEPHHPQPTSTTTLSSTSTTPQPAVLLSSAPPPPTSSASSSSSAPNPPPPSSLPLPPNAVGPSALQQKWFEGQPQNEFVFSSTSADPDDMAAAQAYVKSMRQALAPIKYALEETKKIQERLTEARSTLANERHYVDKFRNNLAILQGPDLYVDMRFADPKGKNERTVRFYSNEEFDRVNLERQQFDQTPGLPKEDKKGQLNAKFRKEMALEFFQQEIARAEQASGPIREEIGRLEAQMREVQGSTNNGIRFSEYKSLYQRYEGFATKCERGIRSRQGPVREQSRFKFTVGAPQGTSSRDGALKVPSDPNDAPIDMSFQLALRSAPAAFYRNIG